MALAEIAALRSQLWERGGYRPVPLLSASDPDKARAGKAPVHKDWTARARRNPPEAATGPAQSHLANTGILADGLRAFDADVRDAALADAIEHCCIEHCGPAPTRRRSNCNHFTMLYRAAEGEPAKRSLKGTTGDPEHPDKIEVLGKGQQLVAHGDHASGGSIYWTGPEPLDMPADKLPVVTEEQITRLFAAVAPIIGAPVPAERQKTNGAGPMSADLARLTAALALIPNEVADDREHWVLVGCAMHHATAGADEAMEVWAAWAARSGKFNPEETERKWASFAKCSGTAQAGAGTIFRLATRYGWRVPDLIDDPGYISALEAAAAEEAGPSSGNRSMPPPKAAPAPTDPAAIWDPWEAPPVPAWPSAILPREIEDTLALVALRDGLELGAVAMAVLAATSAAAPKDARFYAYNERELGWSVPPIIWLMQIGSSGHRKTALDRVAFAPLHAAQAELWRPFRDQIRAWHRLPQKERGAKPDEPHVFIVDDVTPEALQQALGNTMRGAALVKDELAGLFEFDRYHQATGGAAARAFYLSAYEDEPRAVLRITRDSQYVEHTGLTIFGGIQPERLADFDGLAKDGLLPRFIPQRVTPTGLARPEVDAGRGLDALHRQIERLCHLGGLRYTATPDGTALIQTTEQVAKEFASITEFSAGWPAFCLKLHGTHARLALLLHLLETPEAPIVAIETVQCAQRLVHGYVLQHAADFYSAIPGGNHERLLDIAGWLLVRVDRNPTPGLLERIVASDLTHHVKSCRPLKSRGIAEALDPFVVRGWLIPETDYPNNRAWFFDPAIRMHFVERQQAERIRRGEIRERLERLRAVRST